MADETIDRYQIRDQIGAGGMGTVYCAWDREIERDVALKWLPAYFSSDVTFTERFKREARVVARLEHPHIVPIYDVGESEGRPFIIMRLLAGGTLRDRTGQPGFDLAALIKVLEEIGDALAAAHARHIIHRDIKPGNILFDQNGAAFLSDFGIAKVLDSATQLTGSGFIGTPAYMSPEQFIGQGLDGRSDQYSLAIVVYEALTGNLPFQGNTAQMMYKHINAAPPKIDLEEYPIPEAINAVLQKALAKKPDDRYARIQDFVTAMKVAVRESPHAAAITLPLAAGAMLSMPSKPATAPTAVDTPPEQKPDQVQKDYREGLEAMAREEWTLAVAAFDRVLEADPNYGNTIQFKHQAEANLEPDMLATEVEDDDSSAAILAAGAVGLAAAAAVHDSAPDEKPRVDEGLPAAAVTEVEFAEPDLDATTVEPPSRDAAPAYAAAGVAAASMAATSLDLPADVTAAPRPPEGAAAAPASTGQKERKGFPIWAIVAAVIILLLLCGGTIYAGVSMFGGGGEDTVAVEDSGSQDTIDAFAAVSEQQLEVGGDSESAAAVPADTEEPTATNSPTPEPTKEPAVVAVVEEPTEVPTEAELTATEPPTDTPEPEPQSPMVRVIVSSANLRRGPGVVYRTLGPIFRDDLAAVIAKNNDGSWFNIELEDGSRAWIAASVVELVEGGDTGSIVVAATIPVAPTNTPVPPTFTPRPLPTQPPPTSGGGGNNGGSGGGGGGGGDGGGGGGGGGYTPEAP